MRWKVLAGIGFAGILFSGAVAEETIKLYAEPVDGNVTAWKGYRRLFHSIHGSPNNLVFGFSVPPAKAGFEVKEQEFKVTIPPGVRLEEVLGICGNPRNGYADKFELISQTTKGASGETILTFPNLPEFFKLHSSESGVVRREIDLYLEQEKFDPEKEYTLLYDFSSNGQKHKQRNLIVKFLPPIDESEKLPSRFELRNVPNYFWSFKVKDKVLLKRIMRKYEAAGMAAAGTLNPNWEKDYGETLRRAGWKFTHLLFWNPLIFRIPEPVTYAKLADGSISKTNYCITSVFKNKPLLDAVARRNFEFEQIIDGDLLEIDLEPFGYMKTACFCNDCLDRFARQFKIDRSLLDAPATITGKYAAQWLEFATTSQADLMEIRIREFKRRFPNSRVSIYDYFMPFDNPANLTSHLYGCPLDPRLMDKFVDIHYPCTYYHRGKTLINAMRLQKKYLKKPIGVTISTDRAYSLFARYLSGNDMLTPSGTRLQILTAAALGAPGVLNYSQNFCQDGYTFVNIGKVMREIAAGEDYYLDGAETDELTAVVNREWAQQHEDEFLVDGFAVIAKKLHGNVLATLFNYGRGSAVKADLAWNSGLQKFYVCDPMGKVRFLYGKNEIWNAADFASSFKVMVGPEDAAFVLISAKKPVGYDSFRAENITAQAASASSEKGMSVAITAERTYLQELLARDFKSTRHQTSTIDHTEEIVVVTTPAQAVTFDKRSGLIIEWKDLKHGKTPITVFVPEKYDFTRGGAWAIIEGSKSYSELFRGMHLPYRVCDQNIVDDATVVMKVGSLQKDFFISKEFTISPTEPQLKITTSVENLTEYPAKMSLWFRNCFQTPSITASLGGREVQLRALNNYYYPAANAAGRAKLQVRKNEYLGESFNGNTAGLSFKSGQIEFAWQEKDVSSTLFYQDGKIATFELMTYEKPLASLKKYVCSYEMESK